MLYQQRRPCYVTWLGVPMQMGFDAAGMHQDRGPHV